MFMGGIQIIRVRRKKVGKGEIIEIDFQWQLPKKKSR